jgi:alcohol dehydrogenase class IV
MQKSSLKVTVFDDIFPNPTADLADRGAGIARKNGCGVVVGLGGGSAMDAAKGISVVAIPTTAGTGSEATPCAVFTNPEIHRKDAVVSHQTFPIVSHGLTH